MVAYEIEELKGIKNMLIERVVYCFVCLFLCGYMIYKWQKTKDMLYLSVFSIQIVSMVAQLVAVFSNLYVDWFMQLYILIFNIILPVCVLYAEFVHINFEEYVQVKLGDFYFKKGNHEKAIEKYKKAVEKNNQNSQVFAKLGMAYNAIGDRRTAFDRFARAIELDRNDFRSYYEIGSIFNDMGKVSDAQIVLDNALRIKPDFTPASELLANVLCAQNKFDEAVHVYKNATRYDPDNYQLYYSMGVVKTETRDFSVAKECYQKAIALNPCLYQAHFSLGQIYLLKGELEEAEEMFKKALVSKDLTAKCYYQLAKVYVLKDDNVRAVTNLGYAIHMDASYQYKAESEPLFGKIKDYITGLNMANTVMEKGEMYEKQKRKEKQEESKGSKETRSVKETKGTNGKANEKETKIAKESKKEKEDPKKFFMPEKEPNESDKFRRDSVFEKVKKPEDKKQKWQEALKIFLGLDCKEEEADASKEKEFFRVPRKRDMANQKIEKKQEETIEREEEKQGTSSLLEKKESDKVNSLFTNLEEKQTASYEETLKREKELEPVEGLGTSNAMPTKESLTEKENNTEEKLDIFEKFKKLKQEEDAKAEKIRRDRKRKELERLRQMEEATQNSQMQDKGTNWQATNTIATEWEEEEPVVVRRVGKSNGEQAKEELAKLEELRKVRNFEIEDKEESSRRTQVNYQPRNYHKPTIKKINEDSLKWELEEEKSANKHPIEKENFEDENAVEEPHFNFLDRFKNE